MLDQIVFKEVSMQNFCKIGSSVVTINLKNQGLILIHGENGVGKSTIMEAIVFALWGKTIRGISGDEVINRDTSKDCKVSLLIECVKGSTVELFKVDRYRKHSKHKNNLYFSNVDGKGILKKDLTAATATDTQKVLSEWLGIDFPTYIRGPMLGQGSFKRFSQMSDAESKAILEDALQLNVISSAQKQTKIAKSQLELELQNQNVQMNHLLREKELLENDIESLTADLENWRSRKARELASLAGNKAILAMELEDLYKNTPLPEGEGVEQLAAALDQAIQRKTALRAGWRGRLGELEGKIKMYYADLCVVRDRKVQLQENINRVGKLQGDCPVCLQTISEEHVEECVSHLTKENSSIARKIKSKKLLCQSAEQEKSDLEERADNAISAANEEIQQASSRLNDHQDAIRENAENQRRIGSLEGQLVQMEDRMISLQQESPFLTTKKMIIGKHKQLDTVEAKIITLQYKMDTNAYQRDHLDFWVKGFGNAGLKSYILRAVTPFLNSKAKLYSKALTDNEIVIKFSTQSTLKSGDIVESFGVSATNLNGAKEYAGNSDGEKARVDLAISFTLSDLIGTRATKAFPQKFFDEPFESMDEAGMEATMDMLFQMVQECGTIFVVTHQPVMQSLFSKVIKVDKKNGITRIAG